ncbi:hypothetical protein P0Y35_05925 [Kiritimatiellaeota bacterium B1221]|nr:hypothetical protein [Kiritimatiellaeota bacterium B1221]
MKTFYLLSLFLFSFSGLLRAQPAAFDISGTIKTVEKKDGREMNMPRGGVEIEEDSKVLQIHLRRTNPTVSGEVTVYWMVMIKDARGNLRPITKGKQSIVVDVGIPTSLESDAFSIKTANYDFGGRNDGKVEQEVEGYAVIIQNAEGDEVGAKFQPKSMEDKVREKIVDAVPAGEEDLPNNGRDPQNRPNQNRRNRMKF